MNEPVSKNWSDDKERLFYMLLVDLLPPATWSELKRVSESTNYRVSDVAGFALGLTRWDMVEDSLKVADTMSAIEETDSILNQD